MLHWLLSETLIGFTIYRANCFACNLVLYEFVTDLEKYF